MTAGVFSQPSVNLFPLISHVCVCVYVCVMWCDVGKFQLCVQNTMKHFSSGGWTQSWDNVHSDRCYLLRWFHCILWIRKGRNDETEEIYCCVTGWDDCSFSVRIYLWFDFKVARNQWTGIMTDAWYDRKRTSTWLHVAFFSYFHSSVCSQGKLLNSPPAAIEKCKSTHPTVTEFPKQYRDLFYSGSRSNKCVFTGTFIISSLRWIWALITDSDTQYYYY